MPTVVTMSTPERHPWFLKDWRKHRDLSQTEVANRASDVAKAMGVTPSEWSKGDVSNYETGARRYNQDVLEVLAIVLRCHPADLLAGPPESKPQPARRKPPAKRASA